MKTNNHDSTTHPLVGRRIISYNPATGKVVLDSGYALYLDEDEVTIQEDAE